MPSVRRSCTFINMFFTRKNTCQAIFCKASTGTHVVMYIYGPFHVHVCVYAVMYVTMCMWGPTNKSQNDDCGWYSVVLILLFNFILFVCIGNAQMWWWWKRKNPMQVQKGILSVRSTQPVCSGIFNPYRHHKFAFLIAKSSSLRGLMDKASAS